MTELKVRSAGALKGARAGTIGRTTGPSWLTAATVLSAPQNLVGAVVGYRQVRLDWSPVAGATSYAVFEETSGWTEPVTTVTEPTRTSGQLGITTPVYTYRVAARAADGTQSELSAPATVDISTAEPTPTDPPPSGTSALTFATDSQIASLSTTSPAALRVKGIADSVKSGALVGGGTGSDIDIKSVDTKAGPIALTTALWYLRTGDSSYLGPLKNFIRATVKPPDSNQALNEFRGLFGIFAAVIQLKQAGAWTAADDAAPCPNHNGDTWTQFLLGGGSQSGPYHLRTVGSTSQLASSLRALNPGVDKTANNWNTVAMATHLAYAALVNNTAEIEHNIKRLKKYLGDQTTGLSDYQPTGDYITSWDNWGLASGKVQAGIGKPDAARPGLDGVVIDDICRGKTGYNASTAYYGAAASGLTYPLEAADYVWAQAALLINGGYNVRSWGAGGNAFDRMNARFNRHRVADEPSLFDYTEAKASVYKGGRFIASQMSQTDYEMASAVATPSGTAGLSRSMPYGDWLAPADGSSTWGR